MPCGAVVPGGGGEPENIWHTLVELLIVIWLQWLGMYLSVLILYAYIPIYQDSKM